MIEEKEQITEAEDVSVSDKEQKTKLPKWVYIAFVGMGAVIIALVIILIVILCGNNQKSESVVTDSSFTQSGGTETSSQVDSDTENNNSSSSTQESSSAEQDDENKSEVTESKQENESKPQDTTSSAPDEEKEPLAEGFNLKYSTDNSWVDSDTTMYGVQFGITNNSSSDLNGGWELVMTIEGLVSCSGWNGTYTADGNKLIIKNAEYNGDIFKGGTVVVGGNVGVKGELKVSDAKINGIACTVTVGDVNQNNQNNNQGNNNDNNNNNNNSEPTADVEELLERSEDAVQGDDWLYTDGNRILDKDGKQVWLTGVNWFGYNTGTNTFDGLWNSQLKPSVEAIADHGFNLIRVPISAELINSWAAGEYPKANYNNAYNTELNNMNSLQIFDYFLKLAEEN